ncbi:MAG TPA: HAD hydrolase-like protein [Chthoniobacterales bacterium]|jgi:phosphoglycolate phosphatase-like HAD superfamily hydrolase|nr:HAD hydrolase-like protein [Chthoniobacterales bacterium]
MAGRRLILWDIDSTLVNTGSAGLHALVRATAEWFGGDGDLNGVEIAGRTDRAIAHQILEKYGRPVTDVNVDSFLGRYVDLLPEELPKRPGRVLPGIRELLEHLASQPDKTLGLLTGNLERGARLKLEHYDLWRFFPFGAFADDHHDRNALGPCALTRAVAHAGCDFAPEQIDVVGDTGHDVACGKAFGARTIAVATGSWSREELAKHQPDFLFDDLANVDEVRQTLGW